MSGEPNLDAEGTRDERTEETPESGMKTANEGTNPAAASKQSAAGSDRRRGDAENEARMRLSFSSLLEERNARWGEEGVGMTAVPPSFAGWGAEGKCSQYPPWLLQAPPQMTMLPGGGMATAPTMMMMMQQQQQCQQLSMAAMMGMPPRQHPQNMFMMHQNIASGHGQPPQRPRPQLKRPRAGVSLAGTAGRSPPGEIHRGFQAPAAAGRRPRKSKGGPTPNPKADAKRAARDTTVRRALSEFFAEGETRPLLLFCREYSRLYAAISAGVEDHPGLAALCDRGEERPEAGGGGGFVPPKGGFTRDQSKRAVDYINQLYSEDQRINGRPPLREWRTGLTPMKFKGACKGIQRKEVEECSATYLMEKAHLTKFRGWRHENCLFVAELDAKDRCIKCRSAASNLKKYHPIIFAKAKDPPPPSAEVALLPKTREIRRAIRRRIGQLDPADVPADPQLALAAKILTLKGKPEVVFAADLDTAGRRVFMVCSECGQHAFKKEVKNSSTFCVRCRTVRHNEEMKQKKKEESKVARVAHDSRVALHHLTHEETRQCLINLREVNKELVRKVDGLERKAAKEAAAREAHKELARKARIVNEELARKTGSLGKAGEEQSLPNKRMRGEARRAYEDLKWKAKNLEHFLAEKAERKGIEESQGNIAQHRTPLLPQPIHLNGNVTIANVPANKPSASPGGKCGSDAKGAVGCSHGKSDGTAPAEEQLGDTAVEEEIAEEPLGHASVGSLVEREGKGVVSPEEEVEEEEYEDISI